MQLNGKADFTVYENYQIKGDQFAAYALFPKEDSQFKDPKFFSCGSFPERSGKILVNDVFVPELLQSAF
ncbi:MAG: hypothetical protein QM689_10290 [Oscillospiraceae bacterium]